MIFAGKLCSVTALQSQGDLYRRLQRNGSAKVVGAICAGVTLTNRPADHFPRLQSTRCNPFSCLERFGKSKWKTCTGASTQAALLWKYNYNYLTFKEPVEVFKLSLTFSRNLLPSSLAADGSGSPPLKPSSQDESSTCYHWTHHITFFEICGSF